MTFIYEIVQIILPLKLSWQYFLNDPDNVTMMKHVNNPKFVYAWQNYLKIAVWKLDCFMQSSKLFLGPRELCSRSKKIKESWNDLESLLFDLTVLSQCMQAVQITQWSMQTLSKPVGIKILKSVQFIIMFWFVYIATIILQLYASNCKNLHGKYFHQLLDVHFLQM